MAYVAAATDAGPRKQVNEDSCCIKVAESSLGEVVMAMVCDGVGGLSAGNLASATVVNRFSRWFDTELPMLMEGMAADTGTLDFNTIKAVWGAQLLSLNELILTHATVAGTRMGTTFTGIITCGGRYLIGHVGDCRAYRITKDSFEQLTEDQTKVARMLANGEITAEEAEKMPKNVILQSVGTQRVLQPVFYEGEYTSDDLFVLCCDGAYHRVENDGIRMLFQKLDFTDEAALNATCQEVINLDLQLGEKDNLTIVCLCTAASKGEQVKLASEKTPKATARPVETDEDDMPTMVEGDEADEDDLPTMVEGDDSNEDDMPTMVEGDDSDEDDMPTMVEPEEGGSDEDDLPTMVEDDDEDWDDEDWDDDDDFGLPTFSRPAKKAEDDQAAWATDLEDEAPTMVEPDEGGSDEDDLPTMVEGADA